MATVTIVLVIVIVRVTVMVMVMVIVMVIVVVMDMIITMVMSLVITIVMILTIHIFMAIDPAMVTLIVMVVIMLIVSYIHRVCTSDTTCLYDYKQRETCATNLIHCFPSRKLMAGLLLGSHQNFCLQQCAIVTVETHMKEPASIKSSKNFIV